MSESYSTAQGTSKSVQRVKVTKTIQTTLPNVLTKVAVYA